MRKLFTLCMMAILAFAASADVTDVYKLKMRLKVPRVYNNTQSLGYRKPQSQLLEGYLLVTYKDEDSRPSFAISNLYNKTHKINGVCVKYTTYISESTFPRLNVIGDNKTEKFSRPTMVLGIEADPSYNIGDLTEDNTLILTLSGFGTTKKIGGYQVVKSVSGNAAGQLGCGCMAYSHVSPTRLWWWYGPVLDMTDDVAAVYGTWRIGFLERVCN